MNYLNYLNYFELLIIKCINLIIDLTKIFYFIFYFFYFFQTERDNAVRLLSREDGNGKISYPSFQKWWSLGDQK